MTIFIFTFFHRYHSIRGIKKQYWATQSPLLIWYFDIKLDKKSLGTKTSRKRCLFASSFSLKLEILKKQTKRILVNTDINEKYKLFLSEKIWQKKENLNFILFIFSLRGWFLHQLLYLPLLQGLQSSYPRQYLPDFPVWWVRFFLLV